MKNLLFFSNNIHKLKEIKKLTRNKWINVLSLNDFETLKEPLENGDTFAKNAKIKSDYGFSKTNIPCFADDSGICINALQGKPGVLSKRYLAKFKNNKECLLNLIKLVKKNNVREAHFKTSVSLTIKKNISVCFEGRINGKISDNICGSKGFGYDPIFIPDGHTKTFGEMSINEKNLLSHRSIAINKLMNFLTN